MKFILTNKEIFMTEKTLQGLVICEPNDPELEPVKKAGLLPNVRWIRMQDIQIMLDGNHPDEIYVAGEWLPKPDFALAKPTEDGNVDAFMRLLQYLKTMGAYTFPKADAVINTLDKLRTANLLLQAGVPTPKTIVLTAHTPLDWLVEQLGLPIVVKVPDGEKGKGVCLIKTKEELKAVVELGLSGDRMLLAQEFIATSKGRDVRVVLAEGELVFALTRDNTRNGDFRSNVAQGGVDAVIEPTEQMLDMARRAQKAVGVDWCGVDLLYTSDGFTVGEVNSLPGFSENSIYQGELVKLRYMRMLLQLITRKSIENKQSKQ